jgi:hypothetical protein
MPGPGYQKKSSKRKTTAPSTAVTSPANENASTASETTTACEFRTFLELADRKSIAQFCNIAASTRDGENLRLLWTRALDEGEKVGMKEGKKLGLREGIEKGMNLGCEQGYLVAKEGFDRAIEAAKTTPPPMLIPAPRPTPTPAKWQRRQTTAHSSSQRLPKRHPPPLTLLCKQQPTCRRVY